ncbi:MAG: hypothetical protein J6Y02_06565 [Pseudobutyrivibrio sp.]|nr:hypothetical protein [Pseudobutyrivibrio sp.]
MQKEEILVEENTTRKIRRIKSVKREFLVNEKDVTRVIDIINRNCRLAFLAGIRAGNCGWALAPECWYIRFPAHNKDYVNILKTLAKSKIELLPETTGYETE